MVKSRVVVLLSAQYQNISLKKLTPMIEKMSMNKNKTRSTLAKAGTDASIEFTTRRSSSFLVIILSGLSPLNALNALSAYKEFMLTPAIIKPMLISDPLTTTTSMMFHADRK